MVALETKLGKADLTPSRRSKLMAELAWELRRLDSQTSLSLAEEAHTLALECRHAPALATSLLARGFARTRLAAYEDALEDALEAGRQFEALADPEGSYRALNLLGIVYGQLGDLSQALASFLETRKLCEQHEDAAGAAAALNNAARVYTLFGDYANALELHLDALRLYEAISDGEGTARTLSNVGSAQFALGRFEAALVSYERALAAQGEWRDPHVHASILKEMGQSHSRLGNLAKAEVYTRASYAQFKEHGDRMEEGHTLSTLGSIWHARGDLKKAEAYFVEAMTTGQAIGDRLGEIMTGLAFAKLLAQTSAPDTALPLLQRTLALAEDTESKADIYAAHYQLAELFEALGDYQQAYFHHKRYAALKDEVFNETSDRKLQSLQVTLKVEQAEREQALLRLKNDELAQMNTMLERQAREDALTGLYNRRHFDDTVRGLLSRAQREGSGLSVMLCDVDNFKRINDSFSHQIGDAVLVTLAKVFRDNLRDYDLLARWGGEEFVIAMPSTTLAQAQMLAERLRIAVESFSWQQLNPDLQVTLSAGLTSDLAGGDFEKMLARADNLLYQAKHAGRNRICL